MPADDPEAEKLPYDFLRGPDERRILYAEPQGLARFIWAGPGDGRHFRESRHRRGRWLYC